MSIVEAVITFAVLSAVFELLVILNLPLRLRVWCCIHSGYVHAIVFGVNIAVHYGTLTGSMTAITAALASFATMPLASWFTLQILRREVQRVEDELNSLLRN